MKFRMNLIQTFETALYAGFNAKRNFSNKIVGSPLRVKMFINSVQA
jgi:hypothetical protein